MRNPYFALLQTPGALSLAAAGQFAKLPSAMVGIAVITMLAQSRYSYGEVGAIAATLTLSCAFLGPQIARLADRFGQSRALPPAVALSVLALASLTAASHFHAPSWLLCLLAAVAGCLPNITAMTRARWPNLLQDKSLLPTAFALESVCTEIAFVVGPPIAIGLSLSWFPEAGPMLAIALLIAGIAALLKQKHTEPPAHAVKGDGKSALRHRAVLLLASLMAAMGVIAGTVDVSIVAYAREIGWPGGASLVLSAYALGSCIGGLLFGAVRPNKPPLQLLFYCSAGTALSTLPIAWAGGIASLAFSMLLSGFFFAPSIILALQLVENALPRHKITEGMTWLATGVYLGVAGGASLSGQIIDAASPRQGFLLTLAAGCCVLSISWLCGKRLADTALRDAAAELAEAK
ncbi:MFS transporter [Chromobacterium sp. IIBBL 290-4]|uniref:MFS transporter n=1 Tax=Chromobacterium sp. IIBBL 290-4 TaxID=2953890 RepID=UPI0020B69895|nr:MFS transporter [Chromobacterium sp. IIBBL 290-4]UTH75086.1 MFS transporter [Chromobacterium sp. IIBBL 290-4]